MNTVYGGSNVQAAKQRTKIDQLRRDAWENKYAKLVDERRRQHFLTEYRTMVEKADAIKDARARDHLTWLTSQRLQEAMLAYDRRDAAQGLYFESQLAAAMVGMNACKDGDELLAGWANGPTALTNLVWRTLAQNQEATEKEIEKLLAQRGH
ncbi:hypothetical protein, partial [Paraburkholderia tropica]|uniref:hypothetical protein n=1 Tax=Paraburkholderia tropica TaxID=92647 RepID=UPI002AAF19BD